MTDIEKLKALALAATKGPWMRLFGERTVYDRMEDGCRGNAIVRADLAYGGQDASNLDFIAAVNPAAVLELIAEVERLRAELAARCRAEGGDTIGALDRWKGHEIMNDPALDCVEFVKLNEALGAAPAAGTVKDAERYRWLRDKSEPGICSFYLSVGQAFKDVKFARETVDEAIDAAIEAHTKAGKD